METSEAESQEDADDDGKESFDLNQPIPPAEDGLPPFFKASKPDFQWGENSSHRAPGSFLCLHPTTPKQMGVCSAGLASAMQPLEDVIRQKFLPALLGRQVSDIEREIFSQILHPM